MRFIGVLAVFGLGLALASTASATPVAVGDIGVDNSWTITFHESGDADAVNHIQMYMETGSAGKFEYPVGLQPGSTGWSQWTSADGMTATLDGPALTDVYWTFHFIDPSTTPLHIEYTAFLLGTVNKIEWTGDILWDGSSVWSYPAENENIDPIPEPVTMAGVFLGIGGLAGYLRKRRAA